MPTYQYSCTECGHFFEQVQSFSDASLTECPACQGRLRKVFNAVGVVFKGSGFYRTDSRSENGAKSTAGASASASKDGASSNGSKDSGSKDTGSSSGKDSTSSSSSSKDTGSGSATSSGSSSGTSKSGSAA